MPKTRHAGPPLMATDAADFDRLVVQRLVSFLRLAWFVYLEPHMDFERFTAFVKAEDHTLTKIVDQQYDDSHIPKTLEQLKIKGLHIDPDVIDEGKTEEGIYLEMAQLFTGMDRHQLRDSLAISAHDTTPLFQLLKELALEPQDASFDALLESIIDIMRAVERKRASDKKRVDRVFEDAHSEFQRRIQKLTRPLITSVHDINREYMAWLRRHPDALDSIAWEAFERLIAEVFASYGFVVEITARCRNQSADLIALRTDELGAETKYLIECKRFRNDRHVDLSIVNAVLGAKLRAQADHAFLVTSSRFSKDVKLMKAQLKDMRLHLRDGDDVRNWIGDYTFSKNGGLWLPPNWDTEMSSH